jgi:hypothetical protein
VAVAATIGGGENEKDLKAPTISEPTKTRTYALAAPGPRTQVTPSRKHKKQEEVKGPAPLGGTQPFFFCLQRAH